MRERKNRQGIAIAEFAIVMALLLVPILAGVWDISHFIDINHILTRAAREGVVMASRGDDPTLTVKSYVESAGLLPENLTVEITQTDDQPGMGQEVKVLLNYNFDGYTVLPWENIMPTGISTVAYAKME